MTKKPNKENKPKLFEDYIKEDAESEFWQGPFGTTMAMLNDLAQENFNLKRRILNQEKYHDFLRNRWQRRLEKEN